MKRVLALVLTVLMLAALFPASVMTQAETVTKEGFYFVNWERNYDPTLYDYVYSMPYTWTKVYEETSGSDWYYPNEGENGRVDIGVYFQGKSSSNVSTAAQWLYEEFSTRPAGSRYLNLAAMGTVFNAFVEDAVDMEKGVALVRDWVIRFLDAYKALGGELDGIAIDLEYNYAYNYYIEAHHYNNSDTAKRNRNIYNDIVENDVYKNRIRPKLVEFEKQGLWQFYKNPDVSKYPYRSEIWTMYRYDSSGGNATCRGTWNWVIGNLLAEYINEAVTEPMLERYPNAILSDYSRGDAYSWYKSMSNSGESTGTSVKVGNATNGVFYGSQFSEYYWASYSGSKTRQSYHKPVSYNDTVFDPTDKYTRALYDVNNQKRLLSSTIDKMGDDAKVNVWVPGYNYANATKSYGKSAYYAEVFYHFGLTDPQPYFGYLLEKDSGSAYTAALTVVEELMTELTRVAGASDRKPIVTPMDWNSDYMLSGMYAGGRNIWRITPDITEVSVEDFKIKDYAPTFSVNGLTITFPQGRIIKDSTISQIGTCGYWVETPADVMPVVTSSADRYAKDPSFMETFTNYKTGGFAGSSSSMLTTTSGRPDTYWTVSGTAAIKANGDNQTLALTGSTTLTNASMAEKVTAGDYYAKQQAWEVTVTLPSGDYGDILLLRAASNDGGVKISDGKIYFAKGSAYPDAGIAVAAGTYTIKRELDFSKSDSYTSQYTLYDANGNLLMRTEKLDMSSVTVPVTKITCSTVNAAAAVELDNFKLYPQGVSTALDLYETTRGRKLTDTNAVRTEDTGYRFTWMNAGDTYKVARIFDAKTGKVIETIEMAPGTDGVAAGMVKVSAGQQIQFAVNVKDETAPARVNYDEGDFSWTAETAERLGLAVGQKLAYTGDKTETPDTPENEDEDENIFDIVGGDGEDLNNGSGDPIISGGDEENEENPGEPENPGNPEEPGVEEPGVEEPDDSNKNAIGGGMIALIVILSLTVLAGGGVAVYIFVVKPKLAAKSAEKEQ